MGYHYASDDPNEPDRGPSPERLRRRSMLFRANARSLWWIAIVLALIPIVLRLGAGADGEGPLAGTRSIWTSLPVVAVVAIVLWLVAGVLSMLSSHGADAEAVEVTPSAKVTRAVMAVGIPVMLAVAAVPCALMLATAA